jgi:hypothetical protein
MKQPVDKFRLCITLITVVYLAYASETAWRPLFTAEPREYGQVTVEVLGSQEMPATDSRSGLWMKALIADGRLLRWESTDRDAALQLQDGNGQPSQLLYRDFKSASLAFRAKRFVAVLDPLRWSGVIRVKREGRTVQMMDVAPADGQHRPLVLEDPIAPRSTAVFLGALVVFTGFAWWLGPWHAGRKSIPWLVFFLAVLHLLYWSSQLVGTNNDSQGYFDAAPSVLRGTPPVFPPGYGALLTIVGSLAGGRLGNSITLLQHAMVVLGCAWLYLLMRKLIGDVLAMSGAILAGAMAPALTVTQDVMSEPATSFAMIGAIYFAVRSIETGRMRFAAFAGVFMGWSGLLRAVPLAALLPAVALLYLFPKPRIGFPRFAVTATVALAIFAAPVLWCGYESGQPQLTNSVGRHLYNRVIAEQKLLDTDGPATRRLLSLVEGKDPRNYRHWEVTALSPLSEVAFAEQDLLLRKASEEGISKNPTRFVTYTFQLAWRTFLVPTDWIATWADTIYVLPAFENPPLVPLSASGLNWRWDLEAVHRELWPVLCWMAIGAVLIGLASRHRMFVLAMACIPVGYLLPTALADVFCPRYNAPIVPIVAVLSVYLLDPVRSIFPTKLSKQPWLSPAALATSAGAIDERSEVVTDA